MISLRQIRNFLITMSLAVALTIAFNFGTSSGWAANLLPSQMLGQIPIAPELSGNVAETAIIFSSPNFLLALVVGVLMALALLSIWG